MNVVLKAVLDSVVLTSLVLIALMLALEIAGLINIGCAGCLSPLLVVAIARLIAFVVRTRTLKRKRPNYFISDEMIPLHSRKLVYKTARFV